MCQAFIHEHFCEKGSSTLSIDAKSLEFWRFGVQNTPKMTFFQFWNSCDDYQLPGLFWPEKSLSVFGPLSYIEFELIVVSIKYSKMSEIVCYISYLAVCSNVQVEQFRQHLQIADLVDATKVPLVVFQAWQEENLDKVVVAAG